MNFLIIVWWLLVAHALCDFSLQTDAMAKGKNRHSIVTPPPNQNYVPCWQYWLSAHALIHGGSVAFVTGSVPLGLIATFIHWVTDFLKCENYTTPHIDQLIHGLTIIFIAYIAGAK